METTPLLNAQDPETRLVLKLLRLQVLTPLAVLVNIATFLICALVIQPSMSDLSRAFPTAVTPNSAMMALLWMVIFGLQILYCVWLVVARKPETRETLVNGVGLRLILANWLMVAWAIIFTLKLWLPSTIILGVLFVFVLWINFTLLWYPTHHSRPLDPLAIHYPLRLWLLALLTSALPQAIFITLDWVYSPDHPEVDYNKRSWEAFGFIVGTNFVGILWVLYSRDLIWTIGGVWIMIATMSKRPKPVPVFAATILFAVLYPLCWMVAIAWHRLREKDKEGVIALPPEDPAERDRLAQERVAEHQAAPANGDEAAHAWADVARDRT